MHQTQRPWLSLWVTIHFVVIALCLINNHGSSQLLSRFGRAVAPYAILLHQDYGSVPLEMTGGSEHDKGCELQAHLANQPLDQWDSIDFETNPPMRLLDRRGANFQRMLSIVGEEKNEEILGLLFDQVVSQYRLKQLTVDRVRLRRRAAYTYEQATLKASGELPGGVVADHTIFECQVIAMPGGGTRLLPVLEPVRRAAPVGATN